MPYAQPGMILITKATKDKLEAIKRKLDLSWDEFFLNVYEYILENPKDFNLDDLSELKPLSNA